MKEKLIIRNFGPIKDVEIEFRSINIFIGDQGTGKSTVSKLYTIIYNYAYYDVFDANFENTHDPNTLKFFKYLELFGVLNYLQNGTTIIYSSEKFNFEFGEGVVKTEHPEFYRMLPTEMPERLQDYFTFNYIPAERVFVSTLADALYGLNELGTKLPTLFNRFGNKFSSARKEKARRNYVHLLGADFGHNNGIDTIITQDGKEFPLSDASTGLQGTMPLLVVFDSIVDKKSIKLSDSPSSLLVIEEPELNLFPDTQKKVLNYLISNSIGDGLFKLRLIINTHSPYILTSINNLMYAYEVGASQQEKVNRIIPKKYWVNPADVSAYRLLPNGTCREIVKKTEDGTLIEAAEIDEVSRELNKEFDELIKLEITNTETE